MVGNGTPLQIGANLAAKLQICIPISATVSNAGTGI